MEEATIETSAETAARLRRVVTRLNRKLRASALGGVSPAQASMLASIAKLESPSLGDLAIEEQIQPPSVTRLVKDMQLAGLIAMSPHPEDRRSTRVTLTATGRKELDTIRKKKAEFIERKLLTLSLDDQRRVREAAALLEKFLDPQ